jgi:hypothetical protein
MIGLKVRRVRNHVPHADHEWSNHECLAYITYTNVYTRSASRFHESFYTDTWAWSAELEVSAAKRISCVSRYLQAPSSQRYPFAPRHPKSTHLAGPLSCCKDSPKSQLAPYVFNRTYCFVYRSTNEANINTGQLLDSYATSVSMRSDGSQLSLRRQRIPEVGSELCFSRLHGQGSLE